MKNLWNPTLSNEEIVVKYKSLISEYLANLDTEYVGQYLKELNCPYFHHEFVKRALVMVMERVSIMKILIFENFIER